MNKVTLHGRLGKDPEIKPYGERNRVSFSLAVGRKKKDEVDWIPCVAWGYTADLINRHFHKGDSFLGTGRIETYKKQDGSTGWNVVIEEFDFMHSYKDKFDEPVPQEDDYDFNQDTDIGDFPF